MGLRKKGDLHSPIQIQHTLLWPLVMSGTLQKVFGDDRLLFVLVWTVILMSKPLPIVWTNLNKKKITFTRQMSKGVRFVIF